MADSYWDLFAAYTAIWTIIAFFVFRLMREQRKLRDELNNMRAKTAHSSAAPRA